MADSVRSVVSTESKDGEVFCYFYRFVNSRRDKLIEFAPGEESDALNDLEEMAEDEKCPIVSGRDVEAFRRLVYAQ